MQIIDLAQTANQSFSVFLDNVRWDIRIKQAVASMVADIYADSVPLLLGQRIVAGTPIIPYRFLQGDGNFFIMTDDDQIPDWQRFGLDQLMIYSSKAEIDAIPANPAEWPSIVGYKSSQLVINNLIISLGA